MKFILMLLPMCLLTSCLMEKLPDPEGIEFAFSKEITCKTSKFNKIKFKDSIKVCYNDKHKIRIDFIDDMSIYSNVKVWTEISDKLKINLLEEIKNNWIKYLDYNDFQIFCSMIKTDEKFEKIIFWPNYTCKYYFK